jgi:HEPN domain-containing protein
MSDIKHARMMLDIANSDRKAIRNMLDADKFDDTIFGFHAQQAVEKLFKAWFSLRGVAYTRAPTTSRCCTNCSKTNRKAGWSYGCALEGPA